LKGSPERASGLKNWIQYTNISILDRISFPEEGKRHFAERVERFNSKGWNAWERIEKHLIVNRMDKKREGIPGTLFENQLRKQPVFLTNVEKLREKYEIEYAVEFRPEGGITVAPWKTATEDYTCSRNAWGHSARLASVKGAWDFSGESTGVRW